MKLSVYSLKNILFQGEAQLLNCKTVTGEITILDHHEPLITVLKEGILKVVDSGTKIATINDEVLPRNQKETTEDPAIRKGEHFFEIKSGFVEVRSNNEVRCIVEEKPK